jgi:hypothetical protein
MLMDGWALMDIIISAFRDLSQEKSGRDIYDHRFISEIKISGFSNTRK